MSEFQQQKTLELIVKAFANTVAVRFGGYQNEDASELKIK